MGAINTIWGWIQVVLVVALICYGSIAVIAGAAAGLQFVFDALFSDDLRLSECPSEDSGNNCIWDAENRGNGTGTSFVVINGEVYTKQ